LPFCPAVRVALEAFAFHLSEAAHDCFVANGLVALAGFPAATRKRTNRVGFAKFALLIFGNADRRVA
jgi:hypothetical protein